MLFVLVVVVVLGCGSRRLASMEERRIEKGNRRELRSYHPKNNRRRGGLGDDAKQTQGFNPGFDLELPNRNTRVIDSNKGRQRKHRRGKGGCLADRKIGNGQ
jgi:hypothetical protein